MKTTTIIGATLIAASLAGGIGLLRERPVETRIRPIRGLRENGGLECPACREMKGEFER